MPPDALHAISLFTNCGAGDVGYQTAGFAFTVIAELEERRLAVAKRNLRGLADDQCIPGDVSETLDKVIKVWRRKHGDAVPDLLTACPPCQGMSSARAFRRGKTTRDQNDARNLLIEVIAEAIRRLSPRVVVLENVPQFLTRPVVECGDRVLSAPQYLLSEIGDEYVPFPVVLDLADFGVPQRRRRTFITLIRKGEAGLDRLAEIGALPYPTPSERTTMGQALRKAGLEGVPPSAEISQGEGSWIDALHVAPQWDAQDWRHRMVAATAPNGGRAWENQTCSADCGVVEASEHAASCPKCGAPMLRPVVVNAETGEARLVRGFRSSSYRRHDSRSVAATITTASGHVGSDTTLHPTETRLLSVAECGVLQTFPKEFDWGDAPIAWGLGPVRAMIGEAVPPHFTEQHGRVLRTLLSDDPLSKVLGEDDPRHTKHRAKLFGTATAAPTLFEGL